MLQEPRAVQRSMCRVLFDSFERAGIHLSADHFYDPIPNIGRIRSSLDTSERGLLGVRYQVDKAGLFLVQLLETWAADFRSSVEGMHYDENNPLFGGLDAVTLYCLLRTIQPASVIEVGSGISSGITAAALADNYRATGTRAHFTAIDPYCPPSDLLRSSPEVEIEVVKDALQHLDDDGLESVVNADLLFVDSSHIHKVGSDVEFLFDRVYPSIPVGGLVHVHDIFSPYHYPKDWITERKRFWNEAYHLENFLRFNTSFEIVLPVHYVTRRSATLKPLWQNLPNGPLGPCEGGSFYFRRTST